IYMHSLEEVEALAEEGPESLDRLLLPPDRAVEDLSRIQLVESITYYLQQGQPVLVPQAPTTGHVRLYNEDGMFLGIGEILDDGRVAPRRMLAVQPG
ncbi:MAG: tRNA pseudouridine(55) synthase TruB, partial [Gammaproteobacteria bacterium]|nr:tRNA pseudouridine(55) synthase TruB [Gammaproteobacteria bacterium]